MREKRQKLFRLGLTAIYRGQQQSFTLIELLVVIAIIAVLIALLLPALKKSKDMVKNVICQNNLRQSGLANMNYVSDCNGYYPYGIHDDPATATGLTPGDSPFFYYFSLYNIAPTMFQCSMDPMTEKRDYMWNQAGNYSAPDPAHIAFWNGVRVPSRPSNDKKAASYGFNSNMFFLRDDYGNRKNVALKEMMIASPSRWGYEVDLTRIGLPFVLLWYLDPTRYSTFDDANGFLFWSHNSHVNFLFGDGHVESVAQIGISSQVITQPWDSQPTP